MAYNFEADDYKSINILKNKLSSLTKDFDLTDWRTVRTPDYWESDHMKIVTGLQHKLRLIDYYVNKGVPLK
jgi:hypothetical protein